MLGKYSYETETGTKTRELLTPQEVYQLDKILVLNGNTNPCLLPKKPFYENKKLLAYSKLSPYKPTGSRLSADVPLINFWRMSRRTKKNGLYADPEFLKALESGIDGNIRAARENYYRKYKATWRRIQRRSTKSFCVSLSKHEYGKIKAGAERHKMSCTRFLKQGALAYILKKYIIPDILAVGTIKQEITVAISLIRKLLDDNLLPYQLANNILLRLTSLEQKVLFDLECPKTLEQLIIETITENPEYRNKILDLLKPMTT